MSDQTEAQDVQSTDIDPQDDVKNDNKAKYSELPQEKLVDLLLNFENRLHEVNNESKTRKLKLRELESQMKESEEQKLMEANKYKELYESLKAQTADYDDLKTYREAEAEKQREKLGELEKQLTAIEREELEILGDIPDDRKLRWIELKVKSRNVANIDVSTSVKGGGSLAKQPKNRRELALLDVDQQKKFRELYPDMYRQAIKMP